jgi:hypothetical protein
LLIKGKNMKTFKKLILTIFLLCGGGVMFALGSAAQISDTAGFIPTPSSSGLGDGQTWQDVRSQRTTYTTYTNTTGDSIALSITVNIRDDVGSWGEHSRLNSSLYVDGSLYSKFYVDSAGSTSYETHTHSAIIPDGSSYYLQGSNSISSWKELR